MICPPKPGNSYELAIADTVRAIFEAKVVSIFLVGYCYCVITKVGDYYISYSGLEKPSVAKGAYVKRDQELGVLASYDNRYTLELIIMNKAMQELDPMLWIKPFPDCLMPPLPI